MPKAVIAGDEELSALLAERHVMKAGDDSMRAAAEAAMRFSETLPNDQYVIPERSPVALDRAQSGRGTRRPTRAITC